jgi:hypothetical protein
MISRPEIDLQDPRPKTLGQEEGASKFGFGRAQP